MKKALFLIGLIGIIAAIVFHTSPTVVAAASSFSATVDAATEQHILRSTVQIAMYEFDNGNGIESGGRGLGTVVQHEGQSIIVTHDHWTHIHANLNVVEFSNAQGALLVSLNAAQFQTLIQYRDGGTMILSVPAGLETIIPATMADASTAQPNDMLWLARRTPFGSRSTVEVVGARLDTIHTGNSPAYLKMTAADNNVFIPGDSGGGVWMNGRLVANNWSSGLMITQSWVDRLLGTEQTDETSTVHAALAPIHSLSTTPITDADGSSQSQSSNLEAKLISE